MTERAKRAPARPKKRDRPDQRKHGERLRDPAARMAHASRARAGMVEPAAQYSDADLRGIASLREAKRVREVLSAHKLKIELDKMRGEVIERAEVERMLVQRIAVFRRLLRSFGRRVAPQVLGMADVRECAILLQAEADGVLQAAYEQRWDAFEPAAEEQLGSAAAEQLSSAAAV